MGVCFKGYDVIAKLLIDHGANVNAVSSNNSTALIYAATFGQDKIVKLLLEHGADHTHKDSSGHTALDHAKMRNVEAVITLLENR